MLCSGCQWALQFTSTCKEQRTAFTTTLERIQACAEIERCFLCTAIYKAVHTTGSGFERILEYTKSAEELGQEEPAELVLVYSSEIGTRPHYSDYLHERDVILVIRWRLPWFPKNSFAASKDGSVASLKFFFSPMDKNQERDESVGIDIKLLNKGAPSLVNIKYRRKVRNENCPECRALNLPDEAFRVFVDEEQPEIVDTENPEEDDDNNTALRDGFRFDFEIDGTVASDYTGSDQTWNQIRRWMKTCNDNHEMCPKLPLNWDDATIPYPTRLLDLQPLDGLYSPMRLITTQDEKPTGRYMTLSHCWGKQHVINLTSENLREFSKRIPFENLSKTFQDAVVITRKIGIRYLWIDSLCIIQQGSDSRKDWHAESATMDQVYRGSFLNIGATGAVDGRDGCFRERDFMDVFRPALWKSECMTHYQQFRQKYRLVERSFLDDWLLNEPLLQRGWVYQERFLTPRMLHFGSRQLFWECREMTVCESFPTHLLPPIAMMTLNHLAVSRQPGSFGGRDIIKRLGHIQWHRVVEEYCSKSLTRGEDKLVAISGVARRYWEVVLDEEDKYWAGIWSSDFPHGLFWTVQNGQGNRPDKWRAPTWSWASIDGATRWGSAKYFGGNRKDRLLAIFDEPQIERATHSIPFGAITAAAWKWKTRLIQVQAFLEDGKDLWRLSHEGREIENSKWIPDEPAEGSVVTLLCLCVMSGEKGMEGLTVARVEETDDEYVRTGVFELWSEDEDDRNKGSREGDSKDGNDEVKGDESESKGKRDEAEQLVPTNGTSDGDDSLQLTKTSGKNGEEVETAGNKEKEKDTGDGDGDESKVWFCPPSPFDSIWELGVELGNENHWDILNNENLGEEEVFWLV